MVGEIRDLVSPGRVPLPIKQRESAHAVLSSAQGSRVSAQGADLRAVLPRARDPKRIHASFLP